jgi:AcrR family transcriptional regulator
MYQRAAEGNPIADLPPKAQAIIRAAQRILERDGFARLSFETIAAEAGVYTSAIRYYFGSKDGLIEALVDATTHDASLQVYERTRGEQDPVSRVRTAVSESRQLPLSETYQTMWEVLPHILRSKDLRKRVAGLYELYRTHHEEVFEAGDDEESRATARHYGSLFLAVLDGIAIQKSLDPEGVDVDAIFDLWARVLSESMGAGGGAPPPPRLRRLIGAGRRRPEARGADPAQARP